ncbi:MAG TPA: hypothetical protein PLC58_11600 [Denitromonas sp.]|nr:hypothetical protein [Denitromonas sp.]
MMIPLSVVRAAVGAAVVCAAGAVQAGVFKCAQPDGRVLYQAVPCVSAGEQINASPASGPAYDPWRKSAGERDIEKLERIEREREYNRDVSRMEGRADDLYKRADKRRCAGIAERADYYRAKERSEGVPYWIDHYKAGRLAAEARYDRECR